MNLYTMTDEERAWLVGLNDQLWPKEHTSLNPNIKHHITMDAFRPLTSDELAKIECLISERGLLTSMISVGMFGGYGMDVYEHELAPDLGPTFLLRLVEGNMPLPAPEQAGEARYKRPGGGVGRQDAWECFSRYTHSKQNAEWLQSYAMRPPRERNYYDY